MSQWELDMEARVVAARQARRVANCAQGTGHVVDACSPFCDACGHDVRQPQPGTK